MSIERLLMGVTLNPQSWVGYIEGNGGGYPTHYMSKRGDIYLVTHRANPDLYQTTIQKIGRDGRVLWQKKFYISTGTNQFIPKGMCEKLDGTQVYVLVQVTGSDSNGSYSTMQIVAFSAFDGTLVSTSPQVFGSLTQDGHSLMIDSAGAIRLLGYFYIGGSYYPICMKFSAADLSLTESTVCNITAAYAYGGLVDSAGNAIVYGMSIGDNAGASPNSQKPFFQEFSAGSNSELLFAVSFFNTGAGNDAYPYSATIDASDNVYWGGDWQGSHTGMAPTIGKVNSTFTPQALKQLRSYNGRAVVGADSDGNLWVLVNGAILKFNSSLTFLAGWAITTSPNAYSGHNIYAQNSLQVRGSRVSIVFNDTNGTIWAMTFSTATGPTVGAHVVNARTITISVATEGTTATASPTRLTASQGTTTGGTNSARTVTSTSGATTINQKLL